MSVDLSFANDLSRDEEVVFFPTHAAIDPASKQTTIFVHGWIFEPETDSLTRGMALSALAELLDLEEGERNTALFKERARLFLVDNERNQKLIAKIGARQVPLTESQPNGHIRSLVTLPTAELRRAATPPGAAVATLKFAAVAPPGDPRIFAGRVHLIGPDGWSVVSDIDDTIKHSNVLDNRELMRNTFLRDFRAVDGMSDTYRRWEKEGAAFHYVSGSPWQLYPALARFSDASGFPGGSYHLRYFRLQDRSSIDLLKAPQQFKLGSIEPILQAFPNRKFVLVGDSGEQDPEAYGELARKHPRQVRLIAVRNITGETPGNARLKAAFRDIAPERTLLFREAAELPKLESLPGER